MAAAVETTSLPPAPPARPSVAQRDPAPNLVAYSAGAVCCPDEKSARTAGSRATWVEPHSYRSEPGRRIPATSGVGTVSWGGLVYRAPERRFTS